MVKVNKVLTRGWNCDNINCKNFEGFQWDSLDSIEKFTPFSILIVFGRFLRHLTQHPNNFPREGPEHQYFSSSSSLKILAHWNCLSAKV